MSILDELSTETIGLSRGVGGRFSLGVFQADRTTFSQQLLDGADIIEAEDIVNDPNDPSDDTIDITGYRREDFAHANSDCSVLSLLGTGETQGIISFEAQDFALAGNYDLIVNTFDENDGAGSIQVEVKDSSGNIELDEIIQLNENTSSPFPNDDTFRSYLIEGLNLGSSDTITITGNTDTSLINTLADINAPNRGAEFARIDSFIFNPVDI